MSISTSTPNPPVEQLLDKMYTELVKTLEIKKILTPYIVGIHTGGIWIAEKLHTRLLNDKSNHFQPKATIGKLDISFYRDDFSTHGLNPSIQPSNLEYTTDHQDIILVDDILMSGRTIRAAMNELFDYGRPKNIILAVLISLDAQELPIRPDIVGLESEFNPQQRYKLRGPESLKIESIYLE